MPALRPVSGDDADEIAAIYGPLVLGSAVSFELEPPDGPEMAKRIATVTGQYPWLVAEESGRVAAFAYATAFKARPAYRWSVETTVYVGRVHQRRGVGRVLYGALLEVAGLWGYANAYAGIALPNPASVALHESLDFAPVGVFPKAGHKLGAWHDVGWWHRTLQVTSDPPRPPTPPPQDLVQAVLDAG